MIDMTYIHKGPMRCKICHILKEPHEHPEEWWKSSEYIGVETWDVPKIVAESRRRTLAEVREMAIDVSNNADEIEDFISKLDEMK